jgi:glycosyltransferase involved in cell wall biosynthesis
VRIALDATYSVGKNLSGVGRYSPEMLWCYRPHRLLRSFEERLPSNCRRRLLHEPLVPRSAQVFHGMNQRLPRARLRRAVSTFHDLFVLTGEYSTLEYRLRFQEQAREAAKRSDLILTVSEFTARQVEELLGVERSRLRVIPHGVRVAAARETPRTPEPIVLHVGAIQTRKNISRLVTAFAALPKEWKLVLAGSYGYGAEGILEEIQRSACHDRILVLGYIEDYELERWYERAAIFAFPSLDEGFGMPVLEAMARGVPVLTSNRSALPEVSGDAALLVDPTDVEAIRTALVSLAADEGLRARLGQQGTLRAASFSWEAAVSRTWSAYCELL